MDKLCDKQQKDEFFPKIVADDCFLIAEAMTEPNSGTDNTLMASVPGGAMQTYAEKRGDEYVINGSKHFISNGGIAKLILLHVRTDRKLPLNQCRSVFLVPSDTPGLTIGKFHSKLGRRLINSAQLYFDDMRVPARYLIQKEGEAAKYLRQVAFQASSETETGLWIAEGFTAYYEHVIVRRAGLTTDAELIDGIASDIRDLQTTPGRLTQPVETASLDAWIKYYRSDENTPNTAISYYTKGAVIAFVLDAKVRKATSGARSLDDVMRLAYSRYAGAKGFTEAEFKGVVHEVAGRDFGAWWTSVLQTTEELNYDEALEWLGLRFKPVDQAPGGGPGKAWLGATTKNDGGRLVVTQVRRGTPAHGAGLNVDDEILAIDDFRVRADALDRRLDQYSAGRAVTLLVARRDELLRIPMTLGREPADTWRLEPRPDATPEQQAHRKAWMGESSTSSGTP
jgi:hypothetical protein